MMLPLVCIYILSAAQALRLPHTDDSIDSQENRVAFVFRGESFRSTYRIDHINDEGLFPGGTNHFGGRNQMGAHKRSTCEGDAFKKQQQLIEQHITQFRSLEARQFKVDVYGTTYGCRNGQNMKNNFHKCTALT